MSESKQEPWKVSPDNQIVQQCCLAYGGNSFPGPMKNALQCHLSILRKEHPEWEAASKLLEACENAMENMEHDAVRSVGEWQTGLFCGLEDMGITDRYDACIHGYRKALEKVEEWVLRDLEAAIEEAKKGE